MVVRLEVLFILGLSLVDLRKGAHLREEMRQLDFRWIQQGSGKRRASRAQYSLSLLASN